MTVPRLAGIAGLAAAASVVLLGAAGSQPLPPANVPGTPPPGVQGPRPLYGPTDSSVCQRLERALGQIESVSNANPETTRRYEDAIARQRYELDQTIMQGRRIGCESGGFSLFGSSRPPQCDQVNSQIGRMRSNLDRMLSELGQMRGGNDVNRDLQRRQLINSLANNNCGPQYRAAAVQPPRQRGLLETLFGGWSEESTVDRGPLDMPSSSTFRTVCVRTCDGYYFPISYATIPSRFQEDERACKRLCPAAEVTLYSYRNPGEEIEQAVSLAGRLYTELPNALKYRQQIIPNCSCRAAGQSWAEALGVGSDETVQQGDIIVNEQRAKQMAQPRPALPPQKGKGSPAGTASQSPQITGPAAEQSAPREEPPPATVPGERKVRTVGPQFYPVR